MPQLNLQQLLKGEPLGSIIEKINENFSQLSVNGGGPQGKRGQQGPPGLPGLRGLSGPSGDNGDPGIQVTLVPEDSNWGDLYQGQTSGPVSANSAVDEGYSEGDIWIDNSLGYFFVIVEDSPGNYLFQPYPLSPSVLAGDLWSPDTTSANQNLDSNGIRNTNKFATISLTAEQNQDPGATPGNTSDYLGNDSIYQNIYGFQRSAFKLSIDNVQDNWPLPNGYNRFDGAYDNSEPFFLPFSIGISDVSPIMYFGTLKESATGSFGTLLIKKDNETIKHLVFTGGDNESHILHDATYSGTTGKTIYIAHPGTSERSVTSTYINQNNVPINNTSFWFNFSQQSNINESPSPSAGNDFINKGGLRLRKISNNLDISIWTNNDFGSAPNHVLKATENQRVIVSPDDNHIPGSRLSVYGNLSVGNSYYNISAPSNGAIIEGTVGIGTSSPSEKLHVVGNSRFVVPTSNNSLIVERQTGVHLFRIDTQNNQIVLDDSSSGNGPTIGIGYQNPNEKLAIRGRLMVNNNRNFSGSNFTVACFEGGGVNNGDGVAIQLRSNLSVPGSEPGWISIHPQDNNRRWGVLGKSGKYITVAANGEMDGVTLSTGGGSASASFSSRNKLFVSSASGNIRIKSSGAAGVEPESTLNVVGNARFGLDGPAPSGHNNLGGIYVDGTSALNEVKKLNTQERTYLDWDGINDTSWRSIPVRNAGNFPGLWEEFTDGVSKMLRITADVIMYTRNTTTTNPANGGVFYKRITALMILDSDGFIINGGNISNSGANREEVGETVSHNEPDTANNNSYDLLTNMPTGEDDNGLDANWIFFGNQTTPRIYLYNWDRRSVRAGISLSYQSFPLAGVSQPTAETDPGGGATIAGT